MARADQKPEVEGHAEEREPSHQEPGDRTGFEREFEAIGERMDRRLGGAHIGTHGYVHADEARRPRKHSADEEPDRHRPPEEIRQDEEDHDSDQADRGVLAFEISLCAFAHGRRDLLHSRTARIGGEH